MKSNQSSSTNVKGVRRDHHSRRGAVAVLVAVCVTALIGFMALTIDVGAIYNTKAELQRTADAAAMAAAAELANYHGEPPLQQARETAQTFANLNKVLNDGVGLSLTDVVFGRAWIDQDTGKYVFVETEENPNAVKVSVRREAGSPSGPMSLYFASIFGISQTDVAADATAVLIPRDIVLVMDLSTSHNDDSSLRNLKNPNSEEVANRGVWEYLWDKELADSYGVPQPMEDGLLAGSSLGNMRVWGDTVTDSSWDCTSDNGLVRLPRYQNWSLTTGPVSQTLSDKGYGTYTSAEIDAINSSTSDSDSNYYLRRVRVALGLDRWKSGKSGGQPGGNGDNYIASNEVQTLVPYPSSSSNPDTFCRDMGGNWNSYINYVTSSSSNMCKYSPNSDLYGDPNLQYRYGLKTWVDFLQENQTGTGVSPGFAGSPQQPMGVVADAVKESLSIIEALQGGDMVGLASYATVGYGPSDKPNNMSWLKEIDSLDEIRGKVDGLQPGMWTTNTNVAQGIDKGVEVLFDSPEARPNAAKVMILLTDGIANQVRQNPSYWNESEACLDAIAAARDAQAQGVQIYTISVGANADQSLMKQIADADYDPVNPPNPDVVDNHYHAQGENGSLEALRTQLSVIFENIGGKRPVALIE